MSALVGTSKNWKPTTQRNEEAATDTSEIVILDRFGSTDRLYWPSPLKVASDIASTVLMSQSSTYRSHQHERIVLERKQGIYPYTTDDPP